MGCAESFEGMMPGENQGKPFLNIATLNYSSYNMTPFQFFSLDHYLEQKQINFKFNENIRNIPQDKLNLNYVKIFDAHIKPRYSPLYNKSCGVGDCKFQEKSTFIQSWISHFMIEYQEQKLDEILAQIKKIGWIEKEEAKHTLQKLQKQIEKELDQQFYKLPKSGSEKHHLSKIKSLQEIIAHVIQFDYLIFQTILMYVYGTNSIEIILKHRGASQYLGFMTRFFEKPFLKEKNKLKRIIDFIKDEKIDVLFLQNVTKTFCENFSSSMKDYRLLRGVKEGATLIEDKSKLFCNAAIIVRPDSFRKAYEGKKGNLLFLDIMQDVGINKQIKDSFLKWKNTQTAVLSIGNFILISIDIKSPESDKQKLFQEFTTHLTILRNRFPKKYIIIGGVFNNLLLGKKDELEKLNLMKYPQETQNKESKFMTCHNVHTSLKSFCRNQKQQKQEQDIILNHPPLCKNFLIVPKRMGKRNLIKPNNNIGSLNEDEEEMKVIQRGIHMAHCSKIVEEEELENYLIEYIELFDQYSNQRNKQMHMSKYELGFLPNNKHPFNEYIVAMGLKIPKREPKNQQKERDEDQVNFVEKRPFESSSSSSMGTQKQNDQQ